MRNLLLAAATAAALVVPATAGAATTAKAPDLPSSGCELQEFLGIENVRQCEDS